MTFDWKHEFILLFNDDFRSPNISAKTDAELTLLSFQVLHVNQRIVTTIDRAVKNFKDWTIDKKFRAVPTSIDAINFGKIFLDKI
jgi:hypothetical protein